MKSNRPDPSHFQAWKVAFRKNAHRLISIGYSAGHAKITTNEHKEEHITEFIVCGIKDWMRGSDCPSWCKYYSVHEEAPVSREGKHVRTLAATAWLEGHHGGLSSASGTGLIPLAAISGTRSPREGCRSSNRSS